MKSKIHAALGICSLLLFFILCWGWLEFRPPSIFDFKQDELYTTEETILEAEKLSYLIKGKGSTLISCKYDNNYSEIVFVHTMLSKPEEQQQFYSINLLNEELIDYEIGEDGSIFLLLYENASDENLIIKNIDISGEVLSENIVDISTQVIDRASIDMVLNGRDDIIISSSNSFLLTNINGKVIKHVAFEESTYCQFYPYKKDELLAFYYNAGRATISLINYIQGTESVLENLPDYDGYSVHAVDGVIEEEHILLYTNEKLFLYNIEEETFVTVLQWSDYSILGEEIVEVGISNGIPYCVTNTYDSSLLKQWTLEEEQRTEITIGCIGLEGDLQRKVIAYNSRESEYILKLRNYRQSLSMDYDSAVEMLYREILSGKGPDLIQLDHNVSKSKLLQAEDSLVNFLPLLENSDNISFKDFVASVIEPMVESGALYMIPVEFSVFTTISKEKYLAPDEHYSIEFYKTLIEQSEDVSEISLSKENMLLFLITKYIQNRDGVMCLLEDDTLNKCLETANLLPANSFYQTDDLVRREGTMMFEQWGFSKMEDFLYRKSIWGEDSTFLSYPGTTTFETQAKIMRGYVINNLSPHKEIAWEIIQNILINDSFGTIYFSCIQSILDKQLEDSMKLNYYQDSERKGQEIPIMSYDFAGGIENVYAAREEDVQELKYLIESIAIVDEGIEEITEIIVEEAQFYFDGTKSLSEVVVILKNRIRLFLDER